MSITSDLRSYADTAVSQGKQVLDQSLATAQAQLTDVTGTANDYVGKYTASARENASSIADKATEAVIDLRQSAEKAVNLDAIRTAIEPYLAQAKEYGAVVTERAEGLYEGLRSDTRVAKVVDTASALSGVVLEQVNEHVVKPVQSFTGLGGTGTPAAKPSPKPTATRPASTTPAAATTTTPAAAKSTPAAKKAPARKAPVKRTPKA